MLLRYDNFVEFAPHTEPCNSVFTSEYSLYYHYAKIETSNREVSPKDIMYFEMHSRHLIPEYREFLFNNIGQLYYINELNRLTHKEPHIIINNLFSKLLEINMYKKKAKYTIL